MPFFGGQHVGGQEVTQGSVTQERYRSYRFEPGPNLQDRQRLLTGIRQRAYKLPKFVVGTRDNGVLFSPHYNQE